MANGDQQGCAHDLLLLAGDKRAAGAPEEQCSTTKRGRGRDLFAWHARLPQCVAFKTFVENISNVLSEGHFTVVRTKDFQGIETDSMDPARVALVQGRLTAAVEGDVNDGNNSFCIKMSNVLCCLRNAHAQHFLDLSRPLGSTDVVLHVYEPEVNTYTPTFKLRTLAKEADSIRLRVMDYKILVEIDLQTFRNAIKTAKDHKADSVDFRVFTPKKRSGKRVTTFFVIKYASDEVSSVFPYQSVTEEESIGCDEGDSSKTSGTVCIKASENIAGDYDALPCEDELDTLYCAKFAVDYLFLFVKARPARVFPRRCRSARGDCGPNDVKADVVGLPLNGVTVYYYDIYASELAALSTLKKNYCSEALDVAAEIEASEYDNDPNIAADIVVVRNICNDIDSPAATGEPGASPAPTAAAATATP